MSSIFQPPKKATPKAPKLRKYPPKSLKSTFPKHARQWEPPLWGPAKANPATGAAKAKAKVQGDALDAYGGYHRGDVDVHIGLEVHVHDQLQAVLRRWRDGT